MNGSTNGGTATYSPEQVFPMEVWGEIFRYLLPRDLESCSNATPEWRELLAPKNASFMIPLAFPTLASHLTLKDLLNCRLVCRNWRNGVDNFFQTHPVHYADVADHERNHIHCPYGFRQFRPVDLLKMESFLEENDENPRYNPFTMTRTVVYREGERQAITLDADPVENQILRVRAAFKRFLTMCGSEMWHCWMIFTDEDTTQEDIYMLTQSYLELMPNLKTLTIGVLGENFYRINLTQQSMSPQLMRLVQSHPLPVLKDLVKLNVDSVPTILEIEMLTKHSHLKKLFWKSNTNHSIQDQETPDEEREMKQLEVLRICPFTRGNMAKLNLPSLSFNLRVLDLYVQNEDLGSVFRSVSRFRQSLRYFNLQFCGDIPEEFSENLDLPLVETVKINAQFSKVRNIDFLLTCPSLKMLELATSSSVVRQRDVVLPWVSLKKVEMKYHVSPSLSKWSDRTNTSVTVNSETIIQFDGWENCMYSSNIWELLPKLEVLKVFIRSDIVEDHDESVSDMHIWWVFMTTDFQRFIYTKKQQEVFLEEERPNEDSVDSVD
ncbi:unnamed protein product [Orchesella dallaii]|uniref:F-box domain-containing protein n=1 Tax=Orchesella dallaii TaxID=48710 RepID=A0ABP1RET0_9HEXA